MSAPQPPTPPPRPGGVPPTILLYSLCLLPITAFAVYVVSYGQDEEALERKLREKYGDEINHSENRKDAMSQVYQSLIKNPGSSEEQEARLQQVLKGGRGSMKRHEAIDKRFYGTEEGLELRQKQAQDIETLRAEEKERRRKLKKERKKKKKKKQQQEEENGEESSSSSDSESSSSSDSEDGDEKNNQKTKKKEAAALAVGALALASAANAKTQQANAEENEDEKAPAPEVKTTNPLGHIRTKKQKLAEEKKKRKKKKHKKHKSGGVDVAQIATITAVAGAAAMVGFFLGGGRRQ